MKLRIQKQTITFMTDLWKDCQNNFMEKEEFF